MRIGFVSDIHSNVHALQAVLERLDSLGTDEILCLGDVVGYNAFPAECLAGIRSRSQATLLGNHDWAVTQGDVEGFNALAKAGVEFSRRNLDAEGQGYLSTLLPKETRSYDNVKIEICHGSPSDPLWQYVFPHLARPVLLAEHEQTAPDERRVIALGHTHVPMLLSSHEIDPEAIGDLPDSLIQGRLVKRDAPLLLFNPGSVGQPRDGDPRAAAAVLDTDTLAIEFLRVPYDVEAAARAIREAGLPRLLADRLFLGR